jgi:hypothetical protein
MANGTIAFDTLQTSGQITGTAKSVDTDYVVSGAAKQWVNFDGEESSLSSRNSLNVSSLTDEGTGIYTITFSSAFSAADYSVTAGNDKQASRIGAQNSGANFTTTAFDITTELSGGTDADADKVMTHTMGDLA